MRFYNLIVCGSGETYTLVSEESSGGEWATRADAEQMEKERNAYRNECITRGGRELQALCAKEQAAKDAVDLAYLILNHSTATTIMRKHAQAIIERYEGGKG